MAHSSNCHDKKGRFWEYLVLAVIILFVALVRSRLLDCPLERDEGEFAYMGQLLLKGVPPFVHAYTMKLPGVGAAYAIIMALFGQTAAGIHTGLLIINGLCIFLVYFLARRLFDGRAAAASGASYALLSLSQSVFGVFAHATHFVVLFVLSGFLLMFRALERSRVPLLLVSGICFGLAITMKQHAVFLALFAFFYVLMRGFREPLFEKKRFVAGGAFFLLGVAIPYALIAVAMAQAGVFGKFWFWTVQYASKYATGMTFSQGVGNFVFGASSVIRPEFPLWLLAGTGIILLCTRAGRHTDRLFLSGFFLFSFLAILPGLTFRAHYFVLLLPAVSILAGAAMFSGGHFLSSTKFQRLSSVLPSLLVAAALCYGIFLERGYLFTQSPIEVSRSIYGANPFPEAPRIAQYIKDHTSDNDRIAVLGSEPEIYFYADRLSASGHIYMYGMMENQPYAVRMQMEMMRDVERTRPRYIVAANVATSWLVGPYSPMKIFYWSDRYLRENYKEVGIIDILYPAPTLFIWDSAVDGYLPRSKSFVTVWRRKT